MRVPSLTRSICLLAGTILIALPPASYAEVRPQIDADIPSYIARDALSGELTVSVSEAIKPLVQAWGDDLMRQYPGLQIVVISERSHTNPAAVLPQQTEMMAIPRRMTPTEVGNFLLEFGDKPIAVPVAHHAPAVSVRNSDPPAETSLSLNIQTPESTSVLRYGNTKQLRNRVGLTGYKTRLVKPLWVNTMVSDGYAAPVMRSEMNPLYTFRRSVYLYSAKHPRTTVTHASTELIRYALSRQGQQWALDLGYVPLSFEEVRRVTSRWATSR